jgi:hypothetical protein
MAKFGKIQSEHFKLFSSSSFRRIIGQILRKQLKSVGMGFSSLVALSSNLNSSQNRFSSNTSNGASDNQRAGKDGGGYASRPRE